MYGATVLKGRARQVYKMCKQAKKMKQAHAWRKTIHASIVASGEGYPTVAMVGIKEDKQEGANDQINEQQITAPKGMMSQNNTGVTDTSKAAAIGVLS